ncbi:MAG: DMT family transporter [Proteobacteria bacterium]|nr:DMT family transporter [Pseudomonadota bacterium]
MSLWIPITIFAAFAQNLRFMLQKHLKATQLTTGGATFARFLFAAPLAVLLVVALSRLGWEVPQGSNRTWGFVIIGGTAQIIATMLVVALFAERNFAVGITLKKTEAMLTAVVGFIVLGEGLSLWAGFAILVGIIGVILLSDPPEKTGGSWYKRIFNRASAYGIGSGAVFAVSATCYRGASLSLNTGDFIIRAAFTLACVTTFQTIAMSLWLWWREPGEISRVLKSWRVTMLVGLTGVLGSLGWFMAFTLQNAAYVKALGQIELVFTFAASYLIFKERSTGREVFGIGLVIASILLLVLVIR